MSPGLFDEPANRTGAGAGAARPTILANQANDWEKNLQEVEVVRSGRTGLIVMFVLALVVVAVIALGLAAWSVLNGGDDSTETGAATDTTTPDSVVDTAPVETTTSSTALPADLLRLTVAEDPFTCDGETREFALVGGADPNESIAFSSPQTEGLRSGQADANGELPIRWQCDPAQAGTTWVLTATGETSGRTVTFQFAGVTTPGQPEPTALAIEVVEDPFVCNGETRIFAGLSGAEPNEQVAFSSPQSPGLRSGTADADGNLPVRWQCDAAQSGMLWELTATGETSGRTVTFTLTGG